MSIDFKIREFFYPASILKTRLFLERSQWFSGERVRSYQERRLTRIIDHAYRNVPFYQNLLDDLGFGEIGMPSLDVIRGYSTPSIDRLASENGLS